MSPTYAIAIHGGAGTIARSTMTEERAALYHTALRDILEAGRRILADGGSALDAVTEAVVRLEDCPLFNAGHGAVLTADATHELDACVMDGRTLGAGAVASVARVRNPVRAARVVMEQSGHVLMAGDGAERFLSANGVALVDPGYFTTPDRLDQLRRAQAAGVGMLLDHDGASKAAASGNGTGNSKGDPIDPDRKFGTVGAVALDLSGNLAAATSTGGMTNKRPGRVGDTPIVGAGCYANNATVAVSTTGTGESFIRAVSAYDVSALMEYTGVGLEEATRRVVMDKLPRVDGRGGLVAVDRFGNVALPFNTEGMYRGVARAGEDTVTAIYE